MTKDQEPQQDPAKQPAGESRRASKPERVSLVDDASRGGPTAIREVDFQRRYALILLRNYRVTAATAKEIVDRLKKLDDDSLSSCKEFVTAYTERNGTLKTIHNELERYRPLAPGRFCTKGDPILANTWAEVEHQIGAAKPPVEVACRHDRYL